MSTVNFDTMKEPVNKKFISNPGIYRGLKLVKAVWVDDKAKKDSMGVETTEIAKGGFEIVLENDKDGEFTNRYYKVPEQESEIKYFNKKYVNGVEVGNLSVAEQLDKELTDFAYFLITLTMALDKTFDTAKKAIAGVGMKGMAEAFIKNVFPTAKDKLIDVKIVCANSDSKKSSFVSIAKAGYNAVPFAKYNKSAAESELQFTKYEKENQSFIKYPYGSKTPPANNATATNALGLPLVAPGTTGFGENISSPASASGTDDGDLF